jgi:hypothetical protein
MLFSAGCIIGLISEQAALPGIFAIISFFGHFAVYIFALVKLPRSSYNAHFNRSYLIMQIIYILASLGYMQFKYGMTSSYESWSLYEQGGRYVIHLIGFVALILVTIQTIRLRRMYLDNHLTSLQWTTPMTVGTTVIAVQIALFLVGPAFFLLCTQMSWALDLTLNQMFGIVWTGMGMTLLSFLTMWFARRYAVTNEVFKGRRKRMHLLIGLYALNFIMTSIGALLCSIMLERFRQDQFKIQEIMVPLVWSYFVQPIFGILALIAFIVIFDDAFRDYVNAELRASNSIALKSVKSNGSLNTVKTNMNVSA